MLTYYGGKGLSSDFTKNRFKLIRQQDRKETLVPQKTVSIYFEKQVFVAFSVVFKRAKFICNSTLPDQRCVPLNQILRAKL